MNLDLLNQLSQMNQRTFTANTITKHSITLLIASKKYSIRKISEISYSTRSPSESSQEAAIQCRAGRGNEILPKWFWCISTENSVESIREDIHEITDVNFNDIVKYLKSLHSGTKQLLSEVFRLAKLIVVFLTTNATSEQSLSALDWAKTYLQNTIKSAFK